MKAILYRKSSILLLGVLGLFICFTPASKEHAMESSTLNTGADKENKLLVKSRLELNTNQSVDSLSDEQNLTEVKQIVDLEGSWSWEGRPINDKDVSRNGRMEIILYQEGSTLTGDLIQINGPYGEIPADGHVSGWGARLTGIIIPADPPEYSMVRLRRINIDNDFEAIFSGNISHDGKRIEGFFVNNQGLGGGWFVMNKIEGDKTENDNSNVQMHNVSEGEVVRQEIMRMIDDFQQGIITKDKTMLDSLFELPSTPVIGAENNEVNRQTAEKFIEYLVNSNDKIEEELTNIIIDVHNGIAVMSCQYEYIVDGVTLGSGREVWSLIKTSDGWRIASFLWSV